MTGVQTCALPILAIGARRLVRSALDAPTCDFALIRRRMNIRRRLPTWLPRGLRVESTTLGGVPCDWLTPRLNGYKYFEKPALQYWATALSFQWFGVDEWTARLWPAQLC